MSELMPQKNRNGHTSYCIDDKEKRNSKINTKWRKFKGSNIKKKNIDKKRK